MEPGPFDYIQTYIDELKRLETLPRRRAYARRLAADIVKKQGVEELRILLNGVIGYLRRFALSQIKLGFKVQIGKVEIPTDYTLGWSFAAHLLRPELYEYDEDFVLDVLEAVAASVDWEVREEAASALKFLNKYIFDEIYTYYTLWVGSSNPYYKRALCVSFTAPMPDEEEKLDKIHLLIRRIIPCFNPYLKKSCGPFGLAAVFRRHPERTYKRLKEWLRKFKDEKHAVWNIITVFSQANAKYFPDHALKILNEAEQLGVERMHPSLKRTIESVRKKVLKYRTGA